MKRKPRHAFLFPGVYFLNVSTRFGIGMLFYSAFVSLFVYELVNTWYEPILPSLSRDFFGTFLFPHFRDSIVHNVQLLVYDGGLLYLFRIPMLLGHLLLRGIAAHMAKKQVHTSVVISSLQRVLICITALIGIVGLIHAYSTNHTLRDARVAHRVEAMIGDEIAEDLGYNPDFEVYGAWYNKEDVELNVGIFDPSDNSLQANYKPFPELYIRYKQGIGNPIHDIIYVNYREPLKIFKGGTRIIDDFVEGNEGEAQEMFLMRTLFLNEAVQNYLKSYTSNQEIATITTYDNSNEQEGTVICSENVCRARIYSIKLSVSDDMSEETIGTLYVQATVDNRFFTPTYIAVVDNATLEKTVLLDTISDEEEETLYRILEDDDVSEGENAEEMPEI